MRRHARHTKDGAREVYNRVAYEEAIVARSLRWIKARATNERICNDKALLQRAVRALKTGHDHNVKDLAKELGIPHHTLIFIWRTHL